MNKELLELHRQAGKVKRWHTEFTIQSQTISDHVYNMIRIYTAIWGYPPRHDYLALIYEDIEERITGDWPHWVTSSFPDLALMKEKIEQEVRNKFHIPGEGKSFRVQVCDWLEALEFMVNEVTLGNDTLRDKTERLWNKFQMFTETCSNTNDIEDYLQDSGLSHRFSLVLDGVHRDG